MSLLTNILPTEFTIDGYTLEINSDFRTMIKIDMLFKDNSIDISKKWETAFSLFYVSIPFTKIDEYYFKVLAEYLINFYSCGINNNDNINKKTNSNSNSNSKHVFCFNFDAEYIYSAFLHDYKIDLQKENLHWWIFNSLFKNLSEENEFVKIMKYRTIEINSDMSNKEKEFYRKMKRKYEIPTSTNDIDIEHKNALEEALLKGESIDHLV